ncbi:hypothetical protein [Lysinibacillus sphaericus]|uniref:Uncharacterized protein n=1 Tax=Lysinibacillus sphaericus OT4b.31 TaxID=1285586 RepID=R7ZE34_LYSSH|nr:hypothetical protein [Lysinibacillus sphaericus]EON72392.1 hypothetical protein H131_12503 [Lysinibacillus sphaericus OT4b.31]
MSGIYKYAKYILLLISIINLNSFSPDYLEPILLYEYLIFVGFCSLLGILHDFFKPSKKTNILLLVFIIISSLVLLITSIFYKSTPSIIFSIVMFIAINYALFLEIKQKE